MITSDGKKTVLSVCYREKTLLYRVKTVCLTEYHLYLYSKMVLSLSYRDNTCLYSSQNSLYELKQSISFIRTFSPFHPRLCVCVGVCACVCAYTNIACMYLYLNARTHARTHANVRAQKQTHLQTRTHALTHPHLGTYAYVHICPRWLHARCQIPKSQPVNPKL
jgi:hypothetical protein